MLLARLPSPPNVGDRLLGVVDADIFAPGLNFVFGEADINGRKALISLKRLRQEFYGLHKNENVFMYHDALALDRLMKGEESGCRGRVLRMIND